LIGGGGRGFGVAAFRRSPGTRRRDEIAPGPEPEREGDAGDGGRDDDGLGGLDDERHDGQRKGDRVTDDDPRVFDFERIDA